MRKIVRKTLCTLLSIGTLFGVATGFCAQIPADEISANAAQAKTQTDNLLLPDSYEEYLPLVSPSDVAVYGDYKAIADRQYVYVYNEKQNSYALYEHSANVTELQFAQNDVLYFLDDNIRLHTLDANQPTLAQDTGLSCNSFTVDVQTDVLYYMTISGESAKINSAYLADLSTPIDTVENIYAKIVPALAVYNGSLYYTSENKVSLLFNFDNDQFFEGLPQGSIRSLAIMDGILYYTDAQSNFYAYDFTALTNDGAADPLFKPIHGCSAIAEGDDGFLYVVQGATVRRYSPQTLSFTDFEISSSSVSNHRLSGATDIQLAKNALFINDKSNERVSKLSLSNGAITTYPTAYAADYLATDGETVAIASAQTITLFNANSSRSLCSFQQGEHFHGNVKGIANVYGAYYFLTDANGFYRLTQGETAITYDIQGAQKTFSTPTMLAADVYGNLYVACVNNKVYRFNENDFLDGSQAGDEQCALPVGTTKIAVDYMQTVYALANNAVHILTGENKTVDFSTPTVFTDATSLTSFTFGVEENQTYLLFDGNYVLSTEKLNLPTVKNIPVENDADENIFSNDSANVTVVKAQENALLIEFDLQTLHGADVFPYLSYHRAPTAMHALKLGETGEYTLLAHFDETHRNYRTYLTRSTFVETLAGDEYKTEYTESKTGWLTNAVRLYKFPYLTSLLTVDDLSRGMQITLLGEITQLDHDYYHVSVEIDGEIKTGYVPKAYVNLFNGEPLVSETVVCGRNESNRDSVWRVAYILLGFSAVCILIDYLILRKKQDK